MNLSINPFTNGADPSGSTSGEGAPSSAAGPTIIACPHCSGGIPADSPWESCPFCQKWVQICFWPIVRQNTSAVAALSDQATCFFHPDKAFQACCQRCGRFVCALCDLQVGAEHVCPTCFERGTADAGADAATAEWRYRDVLYDSIAITAGWLWILFWPTIVAALPAVIFLHVKYRKSPRSYLIPRSGWRFWVAYIGFIWVPLLIAIPFALRSSAGRQ